MLKYAGCALLCSAAFALAAPRNVVLMIGDDHGLDAGCYGHPVIKTPSLDRLATEGTRFTHAFAAVSSCSPSRSVILSGMYNHTNGMYGLAHASHHFRSHEQIQSLPGLLRKAGYRTGVAGKLHVAPQSAYPFEFTLKGNGRDVTRLAESAEEFMAEKSDRPFFLLVGFSDPHRAKVGFGNDAEYRGVKEVTYRPEDMAVPPFLPDNQDVRAELAEYAQSVSRMDQGIGKVLEAIERTGHANDTLVIYLSDNGIPFPGAKTTVYDPGLHLPLVIRSPEQKRREVVNTAMVSWVDIAPTILDWACVKPAKTMAGRSVLPILDQENPPGWDTVYASHTFHEVTMYYPMRMIRTREYKYILNLASPLEYPFASDLWESPTWQGVLRGGDKTYGQRRVDAFLHRPREELYDLRSDPGEIKNLAGDAAHQAILEEMRGRLKEWQERTQDPWAIKYRHE